MYQVVITTIAARELDKTTRRSFEDYDAAMTCVSENEESVCAVWRGTKLVTVR